MQKKEAFDESRKKKMKPVGFEPTPFRTSESVFGDLKLAP